MTFGWVRAETIGALINGIFLIALCFSILVQAVERFIEPKGASFSVDALRNEWSPEIEDPVLLMMVAGIGLAINLVGLIFFHGTDP